MSIRIVLLFYTGFLKSHTFTLINDITTRTTCEQIQPLFQTIKVSGDQDTNVIFTDIETGETFTIGYITPGLSEKIKLEKGKWYAVNAKGNITITPVNVRIE